MVIDSSWLPYWDLNIHVLRDLRRSEEERLCILSIIAPGQTFLSTGERMVSWATYRDMITGCSYLSRMAVIFAFPSACLCGYLNQFIWFFKRKRGISREWFTHFFDENWKAR